ncbi:MAG: efflux RND transporter periplasmic adaptor subunit [Bryobacteraceae bacterium]
MRFPAPGILRRWRREIALWLGALLSLGGAAAVALTLLRPGTATLPSNLPVATARKGEFLVIVSCRGELVASRSAQITAPLNVPNLQIVWLAPQGTAVKQGDPVVRFDASGAKRQLQEKQAAFEQAQASLDQAIAQARITAEQDKLELASLRLSVEKAKLEASKKEIVSAIQGEENRIDLSLVEQKLKVQQAAADLNAVSSKSKIASLVTQRDKAKSEVDVTRYRISQMELSSPATGVVNFLMNYSQGWMNAKPFARGDNVWPGSAIAEIPELESLQFKGKTEEIDRGRIKVGQDVKAVLDPFPEKAFVGKLEGISALTEQTFEWPPSRNFRAFASLGQPDNRLRPGMNGRLDVIVDRIQNAISVPAKAVFARGGRPVVLVPGKEGLKPVKVEVVARNPDEVAVRGIGEGTQVALVEELADTEKKRGKTGNSFEVRTK